MRDRKGFTIVELCIAMAVIGILAVISSSNLFTWLDHAAVVDFKWELFARSNEARTRAMASNLQHRVRIDLGGETVTLQRGNLGTGSTAWTNVGNIMVGERGAGVQEVIVDSGTAVTASTFSFLYNPGGQVLAQDNSSMISPMDQAVIHLTSDNPTERATIRIYGFTSKARIEDGWN